VEHPQLDPLAREAIRKYVLSMIILPSAILATVGFALGYAVNDWAKGQAYVAAFESSSDMMLSMAVEAGRAVDDAEEAQKEISAVVEAIIVAKAQIEDAQAKASESLEKLNAVDVFSTANSQIEQIADAVISKTNIDERVGSRFDARIVDLERADAKVRDSTLGKVVGLRGDGPWGTWNEVKHCPTNHYVCGLQQKVEPSKSNNDDTAMNAVRMVCCPF